MNEKYNLTIEYRQHGQNNLLTVDIDRTNNFHDYEDITTSSQARLEEWINYYTPKVKDISINSWSLEIEMDIWRIV